jgi:uncharacterized protein RhaS with RHS repeats
MNGRIYDPLLGRFLSADRVISDGNNLQSYNRYSYVRNNPLTLTDPSGWDATSPVDTVINWLASLFVPDPSTIRGGEPSQNTRDPDQVAPRAGAQSGFAKGMQFVKAEGEIMNAGASLVPGVQIGKDAGQGFTGTNLIGRDASRMEGVTNLGIDASAGVAVEGASKLAGTISKAMASLVGAHPQCKSGGLRAGPGLPCRRRSACKVWR